MDYKRQSSKRFSIRNSVIIWVGGAFLGWALMVVTIYNVLRFPESQVAEDGQQSPAVIAADEKSLNEIAPAAGGNIDAVEDDEDPDKEKNDKKDSETDEDGANDHSS